MPYRAVLPAALALAAVPAAAQQLPAPTERVIQVSGSGIVRTPPDVATLEFWLRGEGATPDAATQALATRQKAVLDGLARLLGREAVTTGPVTVIEARGPQCEDARGYGGRPRLSEGACAVSGYVATMQGGARTGALDRAGTAAGLAARLGANDARLQGFALADPAEAGRRATAAALADAQRQAEAIAAGAKLRLGPIVSVRGGASEYADFLVRARGVELNAPAAPPPPAPVALDTKPRPIETRAQVTVSYAIGE
jgi:uncharacterized protein